MTELFRLRCDGLPLGGVRDVEYGRKTGKGMVELLTELSTPLVV